MAKPIKDAELLALTGTHVESTQHPGVRYRLEQVIGEGSQGVVFKAHAQRAGNDEIVVLKLLRPRAVRDLSGLAATAISKEVGALQRLSEREPPTPYVVRFLDTGTLRIRDHALELPWVALEYVAGEPHGVTLRARVNESVTRGGTAFDLTRARRAIACMVAGINAIHEVGVIHRDVNPANVLCTGSGPSELFKISDFGLARLSSASTYGNVLLGTPGYSAPEQSFPDQIGVGPYSDVFALACCVYFLLTGEPYFSAPTIPETLVAVHHPARRTLSGTPTLSPDLRALNTLPVLDQHLARATHADPRQRPQTATELGEAVLGALE